VRGRNKDDPLDFWYRFNHKESARLRMLDCRWMSQNPTFNSMNIVPKNFSSE
jgi:hypothetical protein